MDDAAALSSFRSIIALWPTLGALSSEIGAPSTAVRKWSQRDNIPAEWWSALLALEPAKSAGVTAEKLTELAARRDRLEVA